MAKVTIVREETWLRGLRGRRTQIRGEAPGEPPPSSAGLAGASALVCVDGSEGPLQALRHLLQWPLARVTLLYVSPSAADGYVECGWMILEAAMHRCRLSTRQPPFRCRLEVGDTASRIAAVCREERPDVLALVATNRHAPPAVPDARELARAVTGVCGCRVLLATRQGFDILVDEEPLERKTSHDDRRVAHVAGLRSTRQFVAGSAG
jgi:hypothetical protein